MSSSAVEQQRLMRVSAFESALRAPRVILDQPAPFLIVAAILVALEAPLHILNLGNTIVLETLGVGTFVILLASFLVFNFLLTLPLHAGLQYAGLRAAHGHLVGRREVQRAVVRYPALFVASMVPAVLFLLAASVPAWIGYRLFQAASQPGSAAAGAVELMVLFFIATIVGGVIILVFSTFLVFTSLCVVDQGLGPIRAIRESGRMVAARFWQVFGFTLLLGLVMSAAASMFGLLGLILYPLGAVTWADYYRRIRAHEHQQPWRGDDDLTPLEWAV